MSDFEVKHLKTLFEVLGYDATRHLTTEDLIALESVAARPDVRVSLNRTRVPFGLNFKTSFGNILLDDTLKNIETVYVNGSTFDVKDKSLNALSDMVSSSDFVRDNLVVRAQRRSPKRRVRSRNGVPLEALQGDAFIDLESTGISYDTFFTDLGGILSNSNIDLSDIMTEVTSNKVSEEELPHFLIYESSFKSDIVSGIVGKPVSSITYDYDFVPVTSSDDSFVGRLLTTLGVDEAEYDETLGVLNVNGRFIFNLPEVDANGVFYNGAVRYLPHYIGYFEPTDDLEQTRVDRLRVIDPVQTSLDALKLQFELSSGDIKFGHLREVTRNLPDFDNHPYGQEILETLKRKVVLDKTYAQTNSLVNEFDGKVDELGAVALTMLDDDAKGVIDPLGTSNGANLGKIFYLTTDAQINEDGSITRGESEHSPVGYILKDHYIEYDNFNRNQMSFNAFLTSIDVKKVKVAFAEFGLWNSDDAPVATQRGVETFGDLQTGDKLMDMHGDKGVVSLRVLDDMSEDYVKERSLEHAVEFAKLNPNLDLIVSGISVASRMNMGIAHEGINSNKEDLILPNGDVVKDGIVELTYLRLPQTAEKKSKDYGLGGSGRNFSNLYRYVLSSKVGEDLYNDAIIDEEVRADKIADVVAAFQRLGVSFIDESKLIEDGNVILGTVDAPVTVPAEDFELKSPTDIRKMLSERMVFGQINIDLGSRYVKSPFTNEPIKDSGGRNVLPIAVGSHGNLPYRFNEVLRDVGLGNVESLITSYARASVIDYQQLTRKNGMLRNIDTMTFYDGAKTDVIVPDPSLRLHEIRSGIADSRALIHRDPAIQSGNVSAVVNIGGNEANVTHIPPATAERYNADFDGDTMGVNSFGNLSISEERKDELYDKACVEKDLNRYGEVYLGIHGAHFKALSLESNVDMSDIHFKDGKSSEEVAMLVDKATKDMITNPNSYGAYAVSFTNTQTVVDTLGRLADDGVKGDKDMMKHYIHNPYTKEENVAVAKALIAKDEWTPLAGTITNDLIANMGSVDFDPELVRTAMDVTFGVTQSVLQMKKNADKLGEIDAVIKEFKTVISGKYDVETSRETLHNQLDGLVPTEAIEKFVNLVAERTEEGKKFGNGTINKTDMSTTKLSYKTGQAFTSALKKMDENLVL